MPYIYVTIAVFGFARPSCQHPLSPVHIGKKIAEQ
jgi:hypothetical protein